MTLLAQPRDLVLGFTRRDAGRFAVSSVLLVLAVTIGLALDIVPRPVDLQNGAPAPQDIVAPHFISYVSPILTEQAKQRARDAVEPRYDYTTDQALAVTAEQLRKFQELVGPVDSAFTPTISPKTRASLLSAALPGLSTDARDTLQKLTPTRWQAVRSEAGRVLDMVERGELRDTAIPEIRARIAGRLAGDLSGAERQLGAELIQPLVIPNSSFSAPITEQARAAAAAATPSVTVDWLRGETIVHRGDRITQLDLEAFQKLGLNDGALDLGKLGGWFTLAVLLVAVLLTWIWRFRREFWHRNNVLLLLSLLFVVAVFALKLTADRAWLPFALPTAAIGMLVAILLDSGTALVMTALVALVAGATGSGIEAAVYVALGGLAGIIAVRKGDRFAVFIQAGVAVFVVQSLVIVAYSLLGARDVQGTVELIGASALAAGGSAVAAVGLFAVLGNLFGILTVFQLLELANPLQPLLRRLLVETPGTYHHSLMVGNLAERAAEAIGADPLLTRVAAYYHDVGKLANPAAFIENQAGGDNVHDELEPVVSAQILKQHVADGIDIAYKNGLPKQLIAFIPQHHGTAVMSYFLARAREHAADPFGGLATAEGRKAGDSVDVRKFRHAGPKPQTREAAIIMLADGVEASVRSLASRDEPAIRAMVGRIIDERIADDQFDECDLTLRDVDRIREAFVAQLLGMYHQRIAYPQNKVVELESRRAIGGGGDAGA
ncbi:MAG: HD family phosphohydrolase [Chloroflexota bacterium]